MPRRRAIIILLAVAVFSLASCTLWKEPKTSAWTTATGMEEHERLMWKSIQQGDWQQVHAHLAGNFVSVTAAGVRDRDATLEHLRQMKISDFSLGEFERKRHGGDMVVSSV